MKSPTQIRRDITDQIIAALGNGVRPWVRPWRPDSNCGRPTSVSTGKPYRGINPLLLELHTLKHGFTSRWWATYRQWQAIGGQVMKRPSNVTAGEWGCTVIFFKPVTKETTDPVTGERDEESFPLLRRFTVFNVDQVEGVGHLRAESDLDGGPFHPDFHAAEELIAATGADIRYGGNEAFYTPPMPAGSWPNHSAGDFVQLPPRHQFDHPGHLFATTFHELAHWSEVRLQWDRQEHGYAMGELIAEMSSCFTTAELQIPGAESLENHAAYVGHWLTAMKNDPNFIFRASSQASKVADFLMSFVRKLENVGAA